MFTIFSILLGALCAFIDNIEYTVNYLICYVLETITGGWVPQFKHCVIYQPAPTELLTPLEPIPSYLNVGAAAASASSSSTSLLQYGSSKGNLNANANATASPYGKSP